MQTLGRAVVGSVLVLGVAAIVASFVAVPYDAITPGSGIDVSTLVKVPPAQHHNHRGGIVLTDVNLVPLRAIDYLFYRFNGADQVVPTAALTGSATSGQFQEQGVIDMANARQAATVVALRTLGYHVRDVPAGAIVYAVEPGSPASSALAVGEVITALDGRPSLTFASLERLLLLARPGQVEQLTVHRIGRSVSHRLAIRLGTLRGTAVRGVFQASACVPTRSPTGHPSASTSSRACLGVGLEAAYTTSRMPFPVSLRSDGIVGPSAGLSFTLGLLDVLSKGGITGGRKIAATGTMSLTGQVGDVGGVAQKTAAVRAAGATVFLVPPQEYAVAKAHAGPSLEVLGVSTIGQALGDLERLGGHIGPLATR